ncbi:MAG: hypothetical protein JWO71_2531 [Candidatus Acidoferrum typicum]|nr:hypothetical protein [Candidatus Acidoferrum typicum]
MSFARARQAAVLPAAAHLLLSATLMLLSSSPALSQVRSRRASAATHSAPTFPRDFLESSDETNPLPTPLRSAAARYNSSPFSGPSSGPPDLVQLRLLTFGARGLLIEQARQQVLAILAAENSCSAWFRKADPAAAAIFESLEFALDDGPKDVVTVKSTSGEILFKHPYSAGVPENAGHDATVLLNANGSFFTSAADILRRDSDRGVARFAGRRDLRVGPYAGNTLPARITTLLHELGHAIGRLPDDSDELSGLSMQNTERVLHACHAEIKASVRQNRDKGNER